MRIEKWGRKGVEVPAGMKRGDKERKEWKKLKLAGIITPQYTCHSQ